MIEGQQNELEPDRNVNQTHYNADFTKLFLGGVAKKKQAGFGALASVGRVVIINCMTVIDLGRCANTHYSQPASLLLCCRAVVKQQYRRPAFPK